MASRMAASLLLIAALATQATGASHLDDPARLSGQHIADAGVPVGHDFLLYCDPDLGQNRLRLVWAGGQAFDLTRVTDGFCEDEPTITGQPGVNFDTHRGEGDGVHAGVEGARVSWSVTASADGQQVVEWLVTDALGAVLLDTSDVVTADHVAIGTALLPVVPAIDEVNVLFHVEFDYYGRG